MQPDLQTQHGNLRGRGTLALGWQAGLVSLRMCFARSEGRGDVRWGRAVMIGLVVAATGTGHGPHCRMAALVGRYLFSLLIKFPPFLGEP